MKKKKLLISEFVTIGGLLMVLKHFLDPEPWIALIGAIIALIGAVTFTYVMNSKKSNR